MAKSATCMAQIIDLLDKGEKDTEKLTEIAMKSLALMHGAWIPQFVSPTTGTVKTRLGLSWLGDTLTNLCSANVAHTEFLFGDDVQALIKAISAPLTRWPIDCVHQNPNRVDLGINKDMDLSFSPTRIKLSVSAAWWLLWQEA